MDFGSRPILVFWESTKACALTCRHCRASAIPEPPPGELSHEEALAFLESLRGFGRPPPVLVMTGGDALERPDLLPLLERAQELHLDGACAATHEGIRQVENHFAATLAALRLLRSHGFVVQVNTVVMRDTVDELPTVARIVRDAGAAVWEVFFLVPTGRGTELEQLTPEENEEVCHLLYDASRYGFVVRTVEAPFFRRVVEWRREGTPPPTGALYRRLVRELRGLLGGPDGDSRAQTKATRDGKGIVFVSNRGDVYPAGFLPVAVGNVKRESLVAIYRESPLLHDIRAARFQGRCGACEYRDLCGGSRARAFAASGNPLGEDPACAFQPRAAAAVGTPGIVTTP